MDLSIWIIIFLPIFIALWIEYEHLRQEKQRRILYTIKQNREKGSGRMSEVIKKYIGKDCIITTMNTTVTGVVEAVEDNWITIQPKDASRGSEIVNIDYISRIREYPRTKSGKRKAIVT